MSTIDRLVAIQSTANYSSADYTTAADGRLPATCRNGDCNHKSHRSRHRGVGAFGYGATSGSWVAPLSPDQFAGSPQADTGAGEASGGEGGSL